MTTKKQDLEDRIRERAYHLWQESGGDHGSHEAHWEQARKLLLAEDDAGEPLELAGAEAADADGASTEVAAETASTTQAPASRPAKKPAVKKAPTEGKPAPKKSAKKAG